MLYSEFIENTGCRDNDHNFEVYKNLEVLYMNSEVSKAQIYEYGKKLVDNRKSEAELEAERQVKAEIEELKKQLKQYRAEAERYNEYYQADRTDKFWKDQRDYARQCARKVRCQIQARRWMIA